jgi:general secretion pathway protein F
MSTAISFTYRAARHDGSIEEGGLEAESRDAAAAAIARRGLFIVGLTAGAAAGATSRLDPADLALGLRLLATLLESGLPIARALTAFAEIAPPAWSAGAGEIAASIREGLGLSAALERCSLRVPPLVIGLVRAGEAGSGLAAAVRRAADATETSAATRAAIRGALAYPALLATAGAISMGLLVGIVIPRFARILGDLGHTLPPATQLVLSASSIARAAALPAALAAVAGGAAWRAWTSQEEGRRRWEGWLLAVPLLGPLRHTLATARVTAALGALTASGVPIGTALVVAARAGGDRAIAARIMLAHAAVTRGESLSRAFAEHDAVTRPAVQLTAAGERSGDLAGMLAHASRIEDERAQLRVRALVRLIEPALIVMFGVGVALVAAALLQAVYSVRPS